MGAQGEVEGAVVAVLPVLLRLVIWLARATLNGAAKEGDDAQARQGLDDMRSLLVSLEISKSTLSNMLNMNQQLVVGFTRQMLDAEKREQREREFLQKVVRDLAGMRLALHETKCELAESQRVLNVSTFMITDLHGQVFEWGELAHGVTGINKTDALGTDVRLLCEERDKVQETLDALKHGTEPPMALKVHMGILENATDRVDRKAFVSLKAVAQRDKEGRAVRIVWIGEDLTEEQGLFMQKHEEHASVIQELARAREANEELSQKLSESAAEKAHLANELSKFRELISDLRIRIDTV